MLKAALQQHSHDASVKYAVLFAWKEMEMGSSESAQRCVDGFASFDNETWDRFGMLLQSSDRSLANAALCILGILIKLKRSTGEDHGKQVRTWLWNSVERYQAHASATQDICSLDFAARSLDILVLSFLDACDQGSIDEPSEQASMIDLLVSLVMDPAVPIAIRAANHLASVARNRSLSVSWYTPDLLTHIVQWLRTQKNGDDRSAVVSLSMMYLELLKAATNQSSRTAASLAGEHNCVQLSMGFFMSADACLQYQALQLLHAFLQDPMPVNRIRSICSSLRLSGVLITISWMLGHEQAPVANAAAGVLETIMVQSPASDLVRALIEQGCVAVFNHLDGSESASACLDYVSREMENEHMLAVSLNSLRQSSNALLIKNVLLALVILSQTSLKIHEMLLDEQFMAEIALPILVSDDTDNQCDDGDTAMAVLAFCVQSCDKCSTVKLDTNHQSASIRHLRGRQQSQSKLQLPPPMELPPHVDRRISLQCIDGVTDGETCALYTHCKAIRQWVGAHPSLDIAPGALAYPLDQFQTATVQVLCCVIEAKQPIEAAGVLKQISLAQTLDLLRLAKAVDSSRAWHCATRSISQGITSETWQLVFHVALETRHPVLMLRSIQFALGLHDMVEKETPEAQNQDRRSFKAALHLTAAQMLQELLS